MVYEKRMSVSPQTITCGEACRRGEAGVCREKTASFEERFGWVSIDNDGWVEFVNEL